MHEHRHEMADSHRHALEIMNRWDQEGWETISCSTTDLGEVSIFARRPRTSAPATPPSGAFSDRDTTMIDVD